MTTKTTVYLPDDLKADISAAALRRGVAEAQVIRDALAVGLARPTPSGALFDAEPFADIGNLSLDGFGER